MHDSTRDASITPVCSLLYCRPGFEKETASEIMQLMQKRGINGYIKARADSGYAGFYPTDGQSLQALNQAIDFSKLIFARQCVQVCQIIQDLPQQNRVTPLLLAIQSLQLTFCDVWLETPDTNDGKQLSSFCKKFATPLNRELEKAGLIDPHSAWRLHLFFLDSSHVYIGLTHIDNSSPNPMGILRLRMPCSAPSRSTLKLEEAIKTLLSEAEQARYLANGMTAVDLGACPGGWTWQLVKRDIRVNAVDNGPMDSKLMASGMVEEIKADGFKYRPDKPVDWLVCDMVERPMHITRLICRWLIEGDCKYALFNLKLPMKKRYDMVMECKQFIQDALDEQQLHYRLRIKHLYHDREEVTCLLMLL
jgi:23S rRNA (cytidine2498-2'-O)-methyltransferase